MMLHDRLWHSNWSSTTTRSPTLVGQLLIRGDTEGSILDVGGVKATTGVPWGTLAASVFEVADGYTR